MASCGNNTQKAEKQSSENTGTENVKGDNTTGKKYGIKSGIVTYTTQMMGMDVQQTLSFDDYGAREVNEVTVDMGTIKVKTVSLQKDGYMYTYNPDDKTGKKIAISGQGNGNIDFRNLSKEMEQKMNLKKLGSETFIGKSCDKYSIDYKEMNMSGTFLVWEGIALKSETKVGGMDMVLVANSIEENPSIPADRFEIPSDIRFD